MSNSALAKAQAGSLDLDTESWDQDVLLRVRDWHTYFFTDERQIKAVNGVSLDIQKETSSGAFGETHGV